MPAPNNNANKAKSNADAANKDSDVPAANVYDVGGAVMVGVGRMQSVIERRMLINYRVNPIVAQQWLPEGFRVQLVDGVAIAGICMIRLARMAPRGMPGVLGWRGENAAHRVAVEWDEGGHTQRGVFITQRFSASPLAVAAGGRLFPGVHTKAAITSYEAPHRITLTMRTPSVAVNADVAIATELKSSVFTSVAAASDFFRAGATGYSPARRPDTFDGLRLETTDWRVEPTTPIRVHSTLFDDLPTGAAELDSVLIMRDVAAAWNRVPTPLLNTATNPAGREQPAQ